MRRSFFSRVNQAIFKVINRLVPWHKLPTPLALANFIALRDELREKNLYDTNFPATPSEDPNGKTPDSVLHSRTIDGTYNDLSDPAMGSANKRFGRNVPIRFSNPDPEPALLEPNPRLISNRLLKRDQFVPATILNMLAGAWIQFQTHDWFNHGNNRTDHQFEIAVAEGDWFESPMRIQRTMADPTRRLDEADKPPTYINPASHWWDASGIYGVNKSITDTLRTFEDGKLILDEHNRLPLDPAKGISRTGFNDNWWLGLMLLHTLFTLEHNSLCDHLKTSYPAWNDEQLFDKARLINSALIAKIHTIEWTPGILQHPALQVGMRANWWGLAGQKLYRKFGRFSKSELISGIPGSRADHHSAPYALTEEFAAVYRLHPLIRDEYTLYALSTGEVIREVGLDDVFHDKGEQLVNDDFSVQDAFYSFGLMHPGAITLHNFPNTLRDLTRPDGTRLDLAAVDIMRDRERGIPRYNQFRQLINRKPVTTFEDITDNPAWAAELREVYDNDVERVDPMVGMYAEPVPKGFGFSDTAFRIFILMASRRLKSDRFFTDSYTPETYTPEGIQWLDDTTMSSVILRHYPDLRPALEGLKNAFAPWKPVR